MKGCWSFLRNVLFLLFCWSCLEKQITVEAEEQTLQEDLDLNRANFEYDPANGFCDFVYQVSPNKNLSVSYPFSVQVRDNVVTNGVDANGNPVEGSTMAYFFDLIQNAIDRQADTLLITYNSNFYPEEIIIDYNQTVGGDETTTQILNFTKVPSYNVEEAQTALTSAMNVWDSFGINFYNYKYQVYCFCPNVKYPWLVQVRNGNKTRTIDQEGNEVIKTYGGPYTIPEMFDIIQQKIDEQFFSLKVTYNEALGYPIEVFAGLPPNIADGDITYLTTSMNVVFNPRADFTLSHSFWNANNIPDYSYRFSRFSMIPNTTYPWTVKVVNRQIVSITDKHKQSVSVEENGSYVEIDSLFQNIQDAFDSKAYGVFVVFSKRYGHPLNVNIDYDQQIADEEYYAAISNFAVTG